MDHNKKVEPRGYALIPFAIFILVYLLSGIILQGQGVEMAFYQMPAPVASFVGIIFAFIMFKGTIDEKFETFVKGCGDENIIIMCLIYILAGAFSAVATASGGRDAVVNAGLSIIPPNLISAGIFIIAAFMSTSTGTSVGTISALGTIALGLGEGAGLNPALVLGALVGGSMFGDNLSIISDTTIAATRTQNVDMRDKFRMNFKIALPAALITVVLLVIFGRPEVTPVIETGPIEILKILPYLFVLIAALAGVNVFLVLTGGIIFSGILLLTQNGFNVIGLAQEIWAGFQGMYEIFLLSMLTGGLSYMVTKEGGLEWVIQKIRKSIKGEKSAEVGISALVGLADVAVANNTVAIIITGPVAKELCNNYKVDPRRSASLLDTFSCVFQGFIPYGAQLLIAAGFAGGAVSPIQVMPFLWYQFILAIVALVSIYVPFTKAKDPWNFEYDVPESKVAELKVD
jgi:Na+/H+ antiporter NhaC